VFYKMGVENNGNMVALIAFCRFWYNMVPFMLAADICRSQCFLKSHWLAVVGGMAAASTNDMTI
jgi:hypothetical protein